MIMGAKAPFPKSPKLVILNTLILQSVERALISQLLKRSFGEFIVKK